MTRITVPSDLLEKTAPLVCGEDISDASFCQPPYEEIDLGAYLHEGRSSLSYIPFVTPVEAEYCEGFTKAYTAYDGFCADIPQDARDGLEAIIKGMAPSADGKPVAVPKFDEVYALVSKQQPGALPDSTRRVFNFFVQRKLFSERANQIWQGLKALAAMKPGKDPDDPAFKEAYEKKKAELMDLTRRICLDDREPTLDKVNDACKLINTDYNDAKGTLGTIGKWVLGVVGGIATALFTYLKTGRGSRSWEAARNTWRESKAKKEGFFTRLWKSFDAFIRAAEAPETPGTAQPGGGGSTDVPPINPVITGGGSTTPVAGGTTTPVTATGGTASAKPEPYAVRDEADISHVVTDIEEAIRQLVETSRAPNGDLGPAAVRLEAALAVIDADPKARLTRLAPLLRSPEALDLYQQIGTGFEEDFFDDVIPSTLVAMYQAAEQISGSDIADGKRTLAVPSQKLNDARTRVARIDLMSRAIHHVEEQLPVLLHLPDDGSTEQAAAANAHVRSIVHDCNNVLTPLLGTIELAGISPPDFVRIMAKHMVYDITNVNGLLTSIVHMNSYEANRRNVRISTAPLPTSIPIPEGLQRDLFRALFEVVHNSVKYSDPGKQERAVSVGVAAEGTYLVFTIQDNGVGMSRDEAARVIAEAGVRLRGELANGTGHGISGTLMGLATRNGWQIVYDPTPGRGITVTVKVDISSWWRNEPRSGGPSGSGGESGGISVAEHTSTAASDTAPAPDDGAVKKVAAAPIGGIVVFSDSAESESTGATATIPETSAVTTFTGPGAIGTTTAPASSFFAGALGFLGLGALKPAMAR